MAKYRVVIIDDEPVILRGLSRMIPWEKYDCEVVGTAGDGQEGLRLIRETDPQIVFTDISMPRMDGLLMISALKSEYGEALQIAILTGFRDFEFAQRALNLGVSRFLLKPSNLDSLEEAVQFMTRKLESQAESRGSSTEMKVDIEGAQTDIATQEERQAEPSEARSFLVTNAVSYMRKNYGRKLTLSEVAENVYVSQWHLSKILNQCTGQSFNELLNTIRIQEAKRLLKDPSLRIGDISGQVGFADVAHFSRVFKKLTGTSANAYRNQLRLEEGKS